MSPNNSYEMVTVGEYDGLAFGGNTIRLMADKYKDMRPGDRVHMIWATEFTEPRPGIHVPVKVLAEEWLEVKAIAIAPFEKLIERHGVMNQIHGIGFNPHPDNGALSAHLMRSYPDATLSSPFMAIYF